MLVWLASYPRSGNTFLRIVLHRLYGLPTHVVYDVDGVAARLGDELVGFRERPGSLDELRASDRVHLVKTHRRRDADVDQDDRMLCLVRDGRDAVVSWAHLLCDEDPGPGPYAARFATQVRRLLLREDAVGTGAWGPNVLSWLDPPAPHRVVLAYPDLVRDPVPAVRDAVAALVPGLRPASGVTVPAFGELRRLDAGFFRRGGSGGHREELPPALADLFWARPGNAAAMARLGLHGTAGDPPPGPGGRVSGPADGPADGPAGGQAP